MLGQEPQTQNAAAEPQTQNAAAEEAESAAATIVLPPPKAIAHPAKEKAKAPERQDSQSVVSEWPVDTWTAERAPQKGAGGPNGDYASLCIVAGAHDTLLAYLTAHGVRNADTVLPKLAEYIDIEGGRWRAELAALGTGTLNHVGIDCWTEARLKQGLGAVALTANNGSASV